MVHSILFLTYVLEVAQQQNTGFDIHAFLTQHSFLCLHLTSYTPEAGLQLHGIMMSVCFKTDCDTALSRVDFNSKSVFLGFVFLCFLEPWESGNIRISPDSRKQRYEQANWKLWLYVLREFCKTQTVQVRKVCYGTLLAGLSGTNPSENREQ